MPPRVRLTADEATRLPKLLARVNQLRPTFPHDAPATEQARWIQRHYADDTPLTLNLTTLLLFEHGVHRSVEQVTQDLAILPKEPLHDQSEGT